MTADLGKIAEDLYALDPAEFTAARDRRAVEARQAGDRSASATIKSWKRASPPAWAVNLLARERPDDLVPLLDLGAQLRDAQARLSADDLRTLARQRQTVVTSLARAARALAAERSRPISEAASRQVEETLGAALADADAAAAVASGRLVRALLHSGIGPVDVEGAVAGPAPSLLASTGRPSGGTATAGGGGKARSGKSGDPGPAAGGGEAGAGDGGGDAGAEDGSGRQSASDRAKVRRTQEELAKAEAALEGARSAEADAEGALASAEEERSQAEAEVNRLQEALANARRSADEARATVRAAAGRREETKLSTKAARRHATAVRTQLEELKAGGS